MSIIKIGNLTKKFNDFVAVDDITLEIAEGEIFGLLGPNGAGKTTTLSMLSTILEPTSGYAKVCGYDVFEEKDMVRKSIGRELTKLTSIKFKSTSSITEALQRLMKNGLVAKKEAGYYLTRKSKEKWIVSFLDILVKERVDRELTKS